MAAAPYRFPDGSTASVNDYVELFVEGDEARRHSWRWPAEAPSSALGLPADQPPPPPPLPPRVQPVIGHIFSLSPVDSLVVVATAGASTLQPHLAVVPLGAVQGSRALPDMVSSQDKGKGGQTQGPLYPSAPPPIDAALLDRRARAAFDRADAARAGAGGHAAAPPAARALFAALDRTMPCQWADHPTDEWGAPSIILLGEVEISPPYGPASVAALPPGPRGGPPGGPRPGAVERVRKVLAGERSKLGMTAEG